MYIVKTNILDKLNYILDNYNDLYISDNGEIKHKESYIYNHYFNIKTLDRANSKEELDAIINYLIYGWITNEQKILINNLFPHGKKETEKTYQ